jgi:hypothetical protein
MKKIKLLLNSQKQSLSNKYCITKKNQNLIKNMKENK